MKECDYGKTSEVYAKYRDIYPKEVFDKLYELGVGRKNTSWLDLGTGTGVIPRGLAKYGADITAIDISKEQIEQAKRLSGEYSNIFYRVSSAEELKYDKGTFDVITACQCFWYFDSKVVAAKIKNLLKKDGMFLKLYMGYDKEDRIAAESWNIAKKINKNWKPGSARKDLENHCFDNPQVEKLEISIPFTRESWHGRMLASRGVMASMDMDMLKQFEEEHITFLQQFPMEFQVKHEVFFISYFPNKDME